MTEQIGNTLEEILALGGPVMWLLLGLSVVALAVILERAWAYRRARIDVPAFLDDLQAAVASPRRLAAAREVAARTRGPVAAMARVGLDRFDRPAEVLDRAMERAALVQLRRLRRGLPVLATIAVAAPLLGFLGTVTGMIAAFDALVIAGISDPRLVALGIKEALYTTAGGLAVAIPVQVAYNVFATKLDGFVHDLETVGDALLEMAADGVH